MTFESVLAARGSQIGLALDDAISEFGSGSLVTAMRYAAAGGKRIRGFLVLEGASLYEVAGEIAMPAAAAIEALHAYSLVHDDLPCMDDDDMRRGLPTVHRKWDEATAVLAGDALQTLAFQLLAQARLVPERRVDLIAALARASGARGMVLGQACDIAAETSPRPLDLQEITKLQRLKTGALIEWSATAGPRMAGVDAGSLEVYARALGLAFQIADDVLDVEGDQARAGKALRKDAEAGKATFVSLLGLDGAKSRARDLVAEAQEALAPFGDRADRLRDLAQFVVARDL